MLSAVGKLERAPRGGGVWGAASVRGAVCAFLLLASLARAASEATSGLSPVSTIAEFYNLPEQTAKAGYPVSIQAVVTYHDPDWNILFVQDATAPTFIDLMSLRPSIERGDRVLVEGTTLVTNGLRRIGNLSLRNLGAGQMPLAVAVPPKGLLSPEAASRFLHVRGTVRSISEEGHLKLWLAAEGKHFVVWVKKYLPSGIPRLLDAKVRLEGVCSQNYDDKGRIATAVVFVSGMPDFHVEEPGPTDPFRLKVTPVKELYASRPETRGARRVRVQGTAVKHGPGNKLVVSDETGGIQAEFPEEPRITAGQRFDVIGFPVIRQGQMVLRDAVRRAVESGKGSSGVEESVREPDSTLPTLTKIRELIRLGPEARRGYPVRVEGVVTYFDRNWRNLFVHDETDGVYVELGEVKVDLELGERIEVTGASDPGGFLPIVVKPAVRSLGRGQMPAPTRLTFQQGATGAYDCRWIEVEGTIRAPDVQDGHLMCELIAVDGRLRCMVAGVADPSVAIRLANAMVRVHGVCGVDLSESRLFVGLNIRVPSLEYIEVLEKAPADPFDTPATGIAELLRFVPPHMALRPLKVRGIVTLARPGDALYMQDNSGAILVRTSATNQVEVCDEVEAVGLRTLGEYTPILQEAVVRVTRRRVFVLPRETKADQILSGEHNAELVQVEGRLLENVVPSMAPELLLQQGPVMFSAALEPSEAARRMAPLLAGSTLRLTGICSIRVGESRAPRSFQLLLRAPSDITVVKRAPWLNTQRLLGLAGLTAVGVVAALGWVAALRRRVRLQTDLIRRRFEKEAALEARYKRLVENANDVILTHDLRGRLLAMNRAGEDLFGFTSAEVARLAFHELVAPEHHGRIQALYREPQPGKVLRSYELDVLTKDGRHLTLEFSTRFIAEAGQPVALESIARDITDRKRAEERLRRSEAQLAKAQSIGKVGSWEVDHAHHAIAMSAEALRLMGFEPGSGKVTPEELLSRVHPADREMVKAAIDRALENEGDFSLDHRVALPDGTTRVVHAQAQVVFGENGEPARVLGTIQDITERKGFEEQLLKLSRAVEQSPTAVIITDTTGRIEYVNPKFSQVTGYALEDVVGRKPDMLKSGITPASVYAEMWKAITDGRQWAGEIQNRKKNGELYHVSSLISPIKNERGDVTHLIALQEDVTHRRELEVQLRQVQKMESVGRLAAGVAHDFNNILTVIQGHASLLKEDPALPHEAASSSAEILSSAQRAADLTRQLLAFSRKQVIQPRVLDMNQVLGGIVRMLERVLGEHIRLEIRHGTNLPAVKADPGMIDQVIMNLAVNARDAMQDGGSLRLSTERIQVDAARARQFPDGQPGCFARLRVQDTGCGMSQATLSRLFEPFFTTKEVGKGTGLGLATVYGIVKQHGGWVNVESTVGVGTTFDVYLPAIETPVSSHAQKPQPPGPRGSGQTVFVVEDETPVRTLAARVLARHGYRTIQAANGAEALNMWADHASEVDLLLTDMVMPDGVSGRELAKRLRARKPSLKVIYVSGYTAELAGADLDAKDDVVFLQKPYSPTKLAQTVSACLGQSQGQS